MAMPVPGPVSRGDDRVPAAGADDDLGRVVGPREHEHGIGDRVAG